MWLLESSIKRAIENAESQGFTPSADQEAQFNASLPAGAVDTSRVMAVAGGKAQIDVRGVLTKTPSIMARIFGGGNTTYTEIEAALKAADADDSISEIIMAVDSPGGSVDGLFELIAAMQAVTTPIKAEATKAASAAYALVSQADTITATGPAAQFGSIGIVVDAYVSENRVSITSSKAPKKRPDLSTEEGRAVIREELDALHDLFVESIAEGRGVSADNINAKFGEGATLLAGEALKRGMIDSITTKQATAKTGGNQQEAKSMDLQTLKAQHPDVYAAAAQEGQDQERDRVGAHLTMGKASGDMETAISAVEDGSTMTATLQAKYMAAGMNRADVQARQDDDAEAGAADGANASDADAEAAAGDNILANAFEACGVEMEG
jgi:ClpP class serine protease